MAIIDFKGYVENRVKNEIIDYKNPNCNNCVDCCDLLTMITEEEYKLYKKIFCW